MSPDAAIGHRNEASVASVGKASVSSTAVNICGAMGTRIAFIACVGPDEAAGAWVRLYDKSVGDAKTGIYIAPGGRWAMPSDDIYTGAISAVPHDGTVDVHHTEY